MAEPGIPSEEQLRLDLEFATMEQICKELERRGSYVLSVAHEGEEAGHYVYEHGLELSILDLYEDLAEFVHEYLEAIADEAEHDDTDADTDRYDKPYDPSEAEYDDED